MTTTTRPMTELDRDRVHRALEDVVTRYHELPYDEDRIRRALPDDLTVAERVTIYSIFLRLAEITRPPELTSTGRVRDDRPPLQNVPGSPAARVERRLAGMPPKEES